MVGKKVWCIEDEFFAILDKYYRIIESGKDISSFDYMPIFSREQVNKAIRAVDDAFRDELRTNPEHWLKKGIDINAGFSRLSGGGKLALVQELSHCYAKFKNQPKCEGCAFIEVTTCTHPESKMVRYGITMLEEVNPSRNACKEFKGRE